MLRSPRTAHQIQVASYLRMAFKCTDHSGKHSFSHKLGNKNFVCTAQLQISLCKNSNHWTGGRQGQAQGMIKVLLTYWLPGTVLGCSTMFIFIGDIHYPP